MHSPFAVFREGCLLLLPVAEVLRILDDGRNLLEDFLQTVGVELGAAVVIVDTVLFLFNVGHLGVAETYDVLACLEGVNLLLKDLIEVLNLVDVAAVSP